MNIPEGLYYTEDHEWIKIEDGIATIGITDFAQSELGEIVYVEVDSLDDEVAKMDVFGTVEAVKTTSDLFAPVSGQVTEFNEKLDENAGDDPALVNSDPYGDGWIIKLKMSNLDEISELLDADAYKKLTES